jgi:hypothetical protein
MGNAGLARALMARADAKPGVIGHRGRRMVLDQQDRETVAHRKALDAQQRPERVATQMVDLAVSAGASVQALSQDGGR